MELALLAIGVLLGLLVGYLLARARLSRSEEELRVKLAEASQARRADEEKLQWSERREAQLREAFQAMAGQALQSNADDFLKRAREQLSTLLSQVRGDWSTHKEELKGLVQPLEKTLQSLDQKVRELEQRREGAYKGLEEHLRQLGEAQRQLQSTTITLSQALKASAVRGRWGELQLRRVVELAGMMRHVDFAEQPSTDEGRPDMIVYLPGGGIIPVDAKAPMESYLKAAEAAQEEERRRLLDSSVRALRQRMQELGRKAYWEQFERAPDLVVMFVPSEAYLASAFEADPGLLEFSMEQRVLVSSPVNLLALLRAVAFGWQEHDMSEQAREITEQAMELYRRFLTVLRHLKSTGDSIDRVVSDYNKMVGSLEARVMPAARKLEGFTESELPEVGQVEREIRKPRIDEDEEKGGEQ
ncbi:MAG: DNA recombination protein RmuC [Candidatus Bipolaricaulota bacterium]